MQSIESIYQERLGKFHQVAEQGAARFGASGGVFADLLDAIEDRLSLGADSVSSEYGVSGGSSALTAGESTPEIDAAVERAAQATGMDPDLIRAVIQVESNYHPDAVSYCGAQGLMQLMPGTATGLGVTNSFDVSQNVMGGTQYLQKQLNNFGDLRLALAAYNAGPYKIGSLGITNPDDLEQYSRISEGVRGYVDRVMAYWQKFNTEQEG